jgi:hypothetical protein
MSKLTLSATFVSAALVFFASLPAGTSTVAISRMSLVAETQPGAVALVSARSHTCMRQTNCHTSARISMEHGADRPLPSIQL